MVVAWNACLNPGLSTLHKLSDELNPMSALHNKIPNYMQIVFKFIKTPRRTIMPRYLRINFPNKKAISAGFRDLALGAPQSC